jgi:hypothetical protein
MDPGRAARYSAPRVWPSEERGLHLPARFGAATRGRVRIGLGAYASGAFSSAGRSPFTTPDELGLVYTPESSDHRRGNSGRVSRRRGATRWQWAVTRDAENGQADNGTYVAFPVACFASRLAWARSGREDRSGVGLIPGGFLPLKGDINGPGYGD